MRLHQITCGHFKADDGSVQKIKNNRLDELMNVLEEIEGKAIIWAHYQFDVKIIIKEIEKVHGPGSVVNYYGLTPHDERQDNIEKFQNNEEVKIPGWDSSNRWLWNHLNSCVDHDLLFEWL